MEITVTTGYFVNQSKLWSPGRHAYVYEHKLASSLQETMSLTCHGPQRSGESDVDTGPGMLAYVDGNETIDSVCRVIVSAVNKNVTLHHLIIHTSIKDPLKSKLAQCQYYDRVKDRILIAHSRYRTRTVTIDNV